MRTGPWVNRHCLVWIAVILTSLCHATRIHAAQTHALIVGIDQYSQSKMVNDLGRAGFSDLQGAVADARAVRALLHARFGIPARNTITLLDAEATRSAILDTLTTLVNERADPGDLLIFYFSGHGTQVKNSASMEGDGLDEAILPGDYYGGGAPIRDKELARICGRGLDRGVLLCLIFDSCNSGDISRAPIPGLARWVPQPSASVDDGAPAPTVSDHPNSLVMSASRAHQAAREILTAQYGPRGVFTLELQKTLLAVPTTSSAHEVFERVHARMRSNGHLQEPHMVGGAARMRSPVFSTSNFDRKPEAIRAMVLATNGEEVVLNVGAAIGVSTGCQLRLLCDGEVPASLQVSRVEGLSRSTARILPGGTVPENGAIFEVSAWASTTAPQLRVWLPIAHQSQALASSAAEYLEGELGTVDDKLQTDLADFLSNCGAALDLVSDERDAHYMLMRRENPISNRVSYRWVALSAARGVMATAAPSYTQWVDGNSLAADSLSIQIERLARIWAWLNIQSPPPDPAFPYQISGMQDNDGNLVSAQEEVVGGKEYSLILRAEDAAREVAGSRLSRGPIRGRYIYVVGISDYGESTFLSSTRFDPNREKFPREISINRAGRDYLARANSDCGTATILVLTSTEALPHEYLFKFDSPETVRGLSEQSPLAIFLLTNGTTRQQAMPGSPIAWSVDRISFKTLGCEGRDYR